MQCAEPIEKNCLAESTLGRVAAPWDFHILLSPRFTHRAKEIIDLPQKNTILISNRGLEWNNHVLYTANMWVDWWPHATNCQMSNYWTLRPHSISSSMVSAERFWRDDDVIRQSHNFTNCQMGSSTKKVVWKIVDTYFFFFSNVTFYCEKTSVPFCL